MKYWAGSKIEILAKNEVFLYGSNVLEIFYKILLID